MDRYSAIGDVTDDKRDTSHRIKINPKNRTDNSRAVQTYDNYLAQRVNKQNRKSNIGGDFSDRTNRTDIEIDHSSNNKYQQTEFNDVNQLNRSEQNTITCQKCSNERQCDENATRTLTIETKNIDKPKIYEIDEVSRIVIGAEFFCVAIFWCFYWMQDVTDGCDNKIQNRIEHILVILSSIFLCKGILLSIPWCMNSMNCVIFTIGTIIFIPLIDETNSIITNVRDIDTCNNYFKNYLLVSLSFGYFLCIFNLIMIMKAYCFIVSARR